MTGIVKWYNYDKGFGFIEAKGIDGDVFLHFSELVDGEYTKVLEGDVVSFELTEFDYKPSAKNIKVIS